MSIHPYQQIDYNYLRPLKSYFKPKSKDEIGPTKDTGREIYYGVSPSPEELKILEEFMKQIKTANIQLPDCWGAGDSLRYLCCMNMKIKDAMKVKKLFSI